MPEISDEEAKKLIEHYLMSNPSDDPDEMATALELPQEQARRIVQDLSIPETAPETGKKTNP
jgi:hypothetical protein